MKKSIIKYIINFCLTCITIVVIFTLTEIGLRMTSYKNLLPIRQLNPFCSYLQADPEKGYDIVENAPSTIAQVDGLSYSIWSNELGCFDRPYAQEKDISLLVGDSFTFAFAPFEDKWGTKLEAILGQRILKCGVGGYGTKQEMLKATSVISRMSHPPKLIILGYFINDLEDDYLFPNATIVNGYPVRANDIKDMETGERVRREEVETGEDEIYGVGVYPKNVILKKVKWWAENHLIIYQLTKYSLRPLLLNIPLIGNIAVDAKIVTPPSLAFSERPWVNNAWSSHLSYLLEFKNIAEQQGARFLVVIIPYKEQVYPFLTSWQGIDHERPQKILCQFFDQEGINYIDVLPSFIPFSNHVPHMLKPDKDLYWRNDPHLNIRGNDLLSLLVSQYILERKLIDIDHANEKLSSIKEKLAEF